MPTYCYRTADGEVVERVFQVGRAPKAIVLAGPSRKIARRYFGGEGVGIPAAKGWPIECVASGVHASQAQDLRDHLRARGVPTEVTSDGNPLYRDAAHRRKALKARGFIDRSSWL